MVGVLEILFWVLVGTIAYAYVGYPAVLWMIRPWLSGGATTPVMPPDDRSWPAVSVVLASRDTPSVLDKRLENLLSLRYPAERLQVLVGLDGWDGTDARLASLARDPRVRILHAPASIGKTALLNRLLEPSSADIVVFTDANAEFDPDAVRHLVAPFVDPRVGCVTGELVYTNDAEPVVRAGEGLYWKLENFVKQMESGFGGTLVATGAIYAMRRSLALPLPPEASDDSTNPLRVLAQGYRVIVEPRARAFERAASRLDEEFSRKARMVTRQLAAHAQVGFFIVPFRPLLAFRLASHKWLRWMVPFMAAPAILVNLALLDEPVYRLTLAAAVAGAGAFGLGKFLLARGLPVPAVLRAWIYLWTVNAAAVVGVLDFLSGRQRAVWAVSASTRS
jgi:cellulose synthase/poly-beta-1,6-N-acetylglucosamine synthase-like glycosyltransferase